MIFREQSIAPPRIKCEKKPVHYQPMKKLQHFFLFSVFYFPGIALTEKKHTQKLKQKVTNNQRRTKVTSKQAGQIV